MNIQTITSPVFCTGFGQSDTHAMTLSDGKANPHNTAGHPYGTITGKEIAALVADPPSSDKSAAQWFIPSSYAQADARSHTAQRAHGAFHWLALDVDENNLSLEAVTGALSGVLGDCSKLIYATRSATSDARKWRALVPLAMPLSGADYGDTQAAFFDLLEEHTQGTLICDRALERGGQLIYLPNKGAYYENHIERVSPLHLTPDHRIVKHRDAKRAIRAETEKQATQARASRAAQRAKQANADDTSPVDHFNAVHDVHTLLERYGYARAGRSDDWRSPMQTTKGFATRCYGDYWISLSGSDAAAEIGAATANGYRHGDAFDLFVHFDHGGDFTKAVAAYSAEIRPTQTPAVRAATSDGAPRPNAPADLDLSHDALASDMGARGWDQDARHVANRNRWFFWTGTHWQADECLDHMTRTRAYLRTRANELEPYDKHQARNLRHKNTVAAVESLARSNPASVASPDDFDRDRMLLGTPGGKVDLRTGELRKAKREDMIARQTAIAPAPHGSAPNLWLRFLAEIFAGDAETIAFMQRAAGYALTGQTTEHKLLFLYGTGRNGKSVFLNTLFEIWGDYARRAASATFLNSQNERHPTDLAGLQGARLVAGSELPKGKTWDESVIKDLTGGDTMTARYMRGDFFDFEPQLTLMIAGNNQPSFRGVDEAIRSRVVLVPFTVTIPPEKRDMGLPDKLKAEGPEILRWAIDGALQWQERGLDVPASISAASAEYFDDEDTLGQFLADETEQDATAFVTSTALHQRFVQWADGQGLHSWTLNTLQKEVKTRGFHYHRRNHGRGFSGIKLK